LPCSLTVNHALIGRNKRQALAAVLAFCGVDGQRLTLMTEQMYQLVMASPTANWSCEITAVVRNGGLA
jgi:prophage maintenance system killer protein